MSDSTELHVSSAKQLMELNKKKEKEERLKNAAEIQARQIQARQIEAEKIALLKKQNELTEKHIEETNKRHSADLVDIKPNFFGIGANLNEAWRRVMKWLSK